ncbi:hypothetical protein [Paenibacillus terrigena]|uniref:hypothetical protein n=1 Tax=Paenibacillus terrigena TaxID=369333 RepID=UPI0028D2EAE9|nr:hypothetical protein [Paenibacillus terrigena]
MYPAVVNSLGTELTTDINANAPQIDVVNASVLPPAPNLMTIGNDETAETVRYTVINGNRLTVERGFQGVAKSWSAGTKVARYFTAYDHDTFRENIIEHIGSMTAHDAAAITNSDTTSFPGLAKVSDVLAYLKSLANNLKSKVAGAIGAPLTATDTADQMESKINTIKSTAANNLNAKGVTASASETLTSLVNKIAQIIRGSGNAQSGDVLAPKTFTNDSGVQQQGTMPNLTGTRTATGVAKWPDGALAVYPEKGYQKGGAGDGELKVSPAQLQQAEPNLQPQNIPDGMSMFGVKGTKPSGKRRASGTVISSIASESFTVFGGVGSKNFNTITVPISSIGFVPTTIQVYVNGYPTLSTSYDPRGFANGEPTAYVSDNTYKLGANGYVNGSGFRLPVTNSNSAMEWIAYE